MADLRKIGSFSRNAEGVRDPWSVNANRMPMYDLAVRFRGGTILIVPK
jgi:hypothetical protein